MVKEDKYWTNSQNNVFIEIHCGETNIFTSFQNSFGNNFLKLLYSQFSLRDAFKKKIAEKETLVHSHLTPSLPILNGTRGMGT